MALIHCPECQREVSDQAPMCPHCGHSIRGLFGYEYRSERVLFGLPLVHIVSGSALDPVTGRLRVAKGIIAIGPVAVGGLALGGSAFGLLSFGGVAVGLIAAGGAAVGLIAAGGAAVGVLLALGGLAIGTVAIGGVAIGYYAIGGAVWGVHALGGNARDPNLVEFFKSWFGRRGGGS